MEYTCTTAKFAFWNGYKMYTVQFTYGLSTWYVFKDQETNNALFYKKIVSAKSKTPNRELAEEVLYEYLNNL